MLVDGDSPQLLPLFAGGIDEMVGRTDWLRPFGYVMGWFSGQKKGAPAVTLKGACSGKCHFIHYDERSQEQMSVFFFGKTAQALGREDVSFEEYTALSLELGEADKGSSLFRKEGGKSTGKYAVVHPGSGSEEKRWPLSRFLAILERLARTELRLKGILVTGEAETGMRSVLEKTILPEGWSWIHCPSLLELCGFLRGAAIYIGNDSGVTHLAAACGSKVLALFRRDREKIWRPFGQTKTLSADRIEDIDPEDVWQEISHLFALDKLRLLT